MMKRSRFDRWSLVRQVLRLALAWIFSCPQVNVESSMPDPLIFLSEVAGVHECEEEHPVPRILDSYPLPSAPVRGFES